ncbi:MAG: cation:proton antiporter [Candidatus Omnitrophica bacterium]|nr:cation:proton antiporter [Candidatus Omnitrophota bacterium]
MFNQLFHHLTNVTIPNLNGLLLGVILFAGTIGGRTFQRFKIPQVVGYVVTGILLGQSGFKIIEKNMIQVLVPFSYFALGLIGFMIGGELKKESFRRYGKQFTFILLAEGLGAFILVSLF